VADDVRVSVNVSPLQINSELVDQVRDIIKESGLDPHRIELEVTEDVLIKDFDQTASMFSRLRALGIQVAMDDFGAGYTSMANSAAAQFRPAEDRPHLHHGAPEPSPRVGDRALHVRAGARARSRGHRRGRRDLRAVRVPEPEGNCELQGYLFSPPKPASAWTDPAALQFAPPSPRKTEPAAAPALKIVAQQAKRAS
jgi:predicted signal transduction protein with EAL and GGDEF domain